MYATFGKEEILALTHNVDFNRLTESLTLSFSICKIEMNTSKVVKISRVQQKGIVLASLRIIFHNL